MKRKEVKLMYIMHTYSFRISEDSQHMFQSYKRSLQLQPPDTHCRNLANRNHTQDSRIAIKLRKQEKKTTASSFKKLVTDIWTEMQT